MHTAIICNFAKISFDIVGTTSQTSAHISGSVSADNFHGQCSNTISVSDLVQIDTETGQFYNLIEFL